MPEVGEEGWFRLGILGKGEVQDGNGGECHCSSAIGLLHRGNFSGLPQIYRNRNESSVIVYGHVVSHRIDEKYNVNVGSRPPGWRHRPRP